MTMNEEKLSAARRRMLDHDLRGRGIIDGAVLDAFARTPRDRFVPPESQRQAYADHPVPIGHGQTISQPYIVALMLQEMAPLRGLRVLEVGAGSGYQTALLAHLAGWVYAVERIDALAGGARRVLAELDIANVTLTVADGTAGWADHAPFDRIICGAAAPHLPAPWIDQLADGGRIVVPVGAEAYQTLAVYDKHGDDLRRHDACAVRFVRLIGRHGWPADDED